MWGGGGGGGRRGADLGIFRLRKGTCPEATIMPWLLDWPSCPSKVCVHVLVCERGVCVWGGGGEQTWEYSD